MSELDDSFVSHSTDESLYVPTPDQLVKDRIRNVSSLPLKVCFMDLTQLDKFMKNVNCARVCATPGCRGELTPVHVRSARLGGGVSICYICNGCAQQAAIFETSSKYWLTSTSEKLTGANEKPAGKQLYNASYRLTSANEISSAVQVGFIAAGCIHMTYCEVLKHALGIDAVAWNTFQSTIEKMYPVVKLMVDRMCDEAKQEMKSMDQNKPGSWSCAVTSVDGTWMTRGFHSKNATFTIRNYLTGALLYRKHLCPKGRDRLIDEELYQGTSKDAEGYAARLIFKRAKEDVMNIAIHWQDADSSSSSAVADHFSTTKIMICGGHAGRAHKKQLEKLSMKKSFTEDFKKKFRERFPEVDNVVCHCKRHKPGCG